MAMELEGLGVIVGVETGALVFVPGAMLEGTQIVPLKKRKSANVDEKDPLGQQHRGKPDLDDDGFPF